MLVNIFLYVVLCAFLLTDSPEREKFKQWYFVIWLFWRWVIILGFVALTVVTIRNVYLITMQ